MTTRCHIKKIKHYHPTYVAEEYVFFLKKKYIKNFWLS